MEGGYLPWKHQKNSNHITNIETYGNPLPTPPHGSYWLKNEDGSWMLKKENESQFLQPNNNASMDSLDETDEYHEVKNHTILEHVIMPEDTLQGICLKYHASVVEVRRLNMFSGNTISFKKSLLIPIAPGMKIKLQKSSKEVIIQRFQNETNESKQNALIYLEENNWDLQVSINNWKSDENWEKSTLQHPSHPQNGIFNEMMNNNYDNNSLLITTNDTNLIEHNMVIPIAIEVVDEYAPTCVQYDIPLPLITSIADPMSKIPLLG
eukprot:gene10304-13850_t